MIAQTALSSGGIHPDLHHPRIRFVMEVMPYIFVLFYGEGSERKVRERLYWTDVTNLCVAGQKRSRLNSKLPSYESYESTYLINDSKTFGASFFTDKVPIASPSDVTPPKFRLFVLSFPVLASK